jgi:plastocyanin domain-containing protein
MKATTIAIILSLGIIGATLFLSRDATSPNTQPLNQASVSNVSLVDGKQIIEINARGGYAPERSIAKAGIPTIVRFNTSGTFDCSASIRIPSLGISQILPQTGKTDIDLGTPKAGPLEGSCGMGMYPFEIEFQ